MTTPPSRINWLKAVSQDLTDAELIWMIGRRMHDTRGFDLAVHSLTLAAQAGYDRGRNKDQYERLGVNMEGRISPAPAA